MMDKILLDLEKKGYSYLEKVLSAEELKALIPLFEQEFKPAKIGKLNGPQRVSKIRSDEVLWIEPGQPPAPVANLLKFINVLQGRLNEHFFLGLKDFECHLAKYPPGSFYTKHLDRFEKDSSRSISFVFYLHDEWRAQDGGELILYRQDDEVLKTILPLPGSLVVFLSDRFPHEVKLCHRERRSLTGWMHTKILT